MDITKIRDTSEMPQWFNIKNYDDTINFSPADWSLNLSERLGIRTLLDISQLSFGSLAFSILHPQIKLPPNAGEERFEIIKQAPIFHSLNVSEFWKNSDDLDSNCESFVTPLSCGEVCTTSDNIKRKYYEKLSEDSTFDPKAIESPYHLSVGKYQVKHAPLFKNNVPVSIDLSGTDKDIKRDFDLFLKDARALTNIPNQKLHITPYDIERLQDYNILPYMDLKIWERITNSQIPARIILSALGANNPTFCERGEPWVAETLKPFYRKVDHKFLRALGRWHHRQTMIGSFDYRVKSWIKQD
jgi:hypothetical protein